MSGIRNFYDLRLCDLPSKDFRIVRRDKSIPLAPDNQRRRFDPPQPSLEAIFRNRKEELGDSLETTGHRDQYLDLSLCSVILLVEEHGHHVHSHSRQAGLTMKEE